MAKMMNVMTTYDGYEANVMGWRHRKISNVIYLRLGRSLELAGFWGMALLIASLLVYVKVYKGLVKCQ